MARPVRGVCGCQRLDSRTKTAAHTPVPHWSSKPSLSTFAFWRKEQLNKSPNEFNRSVLPYGIRTARTIEFYTTRYTPGDTIDSYAYRLERKLDQAMPELGVDGAAQARTEMLKSQFINGLPEPYKTRLYENPQLTFQQCQTTARQLMAAAQLSLLSTPLSNATIFNTLAPSSTTSQMQSISSFPNTQQFKVEPYLPTNASRFS